MALGGGWQSVLPTAPLANERTQVMKDVTLEQTEEEILTFDVSDEALEAAGDARSQNAYTLGACTGLSVCPG